MEIFSGIFFIKEIMNTVPWIYVDETLNGSEAIENLYEKELQKILQDIFGVKKVYLHVKERLFQCL